MTGTDWDPVLVGANDNDFDFGNNGGHHGGEMVLG